MYILIIRHFVHRPFLNRWMQLWRQFFIWKAFGQRVAKTCFFSSPKHRYYCCSRTVAGIGYFGFVETETIQPQNLSVIGHILDLLMNIYTAFAVHISIIPTLHIPLKRVSLLQKFLSVQLLRSQCSISAVRLFNLGGHGVQFATEYSFGCPEAQEHCP